MTIYANKKTDKSFGVLRYWAHDWTFIFTELNLIEHLRGVFTIHNDQKSVIPRNMQELKIASEHEYHKIALFKIIIWRDYIIVSKCLPVFKDITFVIEGYICMSVQQKFWLSISIENCSKDLLFFFFLSCFPCNEIYIIFIQKYAISLNSISSIDVQYELLKTPVILIK